MPAAHSAAAGRSPGPLRSIAAARSPGAGGIGTLTVTNTLTLGGTTAMAINASTASSDLVAGVATLTYGGTLTVTNLAGTLAAGDSFTLFSASSYSGSFSTFNLPALGANLVWDTSSLATSGTIEVRSPPSIATPASASPSTVTGSSTSLSVLGADVATGESSLTYTWAATTVPAGAAEPIFSFGGSSNDTNAAKNASVLFSAAGTYVFTVTITDPGGLTKTSTVSVTVSPTLTTIALSPSSATLTAGQTQQFTGTCKDQFGNTLQPALTWSVLAGSGSISGGLYSPAYANGSATVQAASGGVTATAGVTISGEAQWNSAAGGSWTNSGDWVDSSSQSIIAAPGMRGIAGDTVLFGSTAASTITLDGASPILAGITFNSGSNGYTIGPGTGGTLHLNNGGNSASIAVSAGSQEISAPLALDSSVLVTPVAGSRLGISGSISGPGSALTLNGSGTLVLGGANSYSGGTRVSAGTLILAESTAICADTNLTIGAGGIFIFNPSITASDAATNNVAGVPEGTAAAASGAMLATTTVPSSASSAFSCSRTVGTDNGRFRLGRRLAGSIFLNRGHTAGCFAADGFAPRPANEQAAQTCPWRFLERTALDQAVSPSIAPSTAGDLAWLRQPANGSDNSDQQRRKDVAIVALDAVFAQYGH